MLILNMDFIHLYKIESYRSVLIFLFFGEKSVLLLLLILDLNNATQTQIKILTM